MLTYALKVTLKMTSKKNYRIIFNQNKRSQSNGDFNVFEMDYNVRSFFGK